MNIIKKGLMTACIMVGIFTNSIYAEEYKIQVPQSLVDNSCPNATFCSSYFEQGIITISSNDNNSSKITLNFIPGTIEDYEDETYLYIVTIPYEAAVTDISFYNIDRLEAAPAMEEYEYESKIPKAIFDYSLGQSWKKLPGMLGKTLPYIKLAMALLSPTSTSYQYSLLYSLPENSILDKQLYPYNSYYQFFNRNKNIVSRVTFTINKSLDTLINLIRTHKMSVYIGGSCENELLIEGLSSFESASASKPTAPSSMSATALSSNSIQLSWSDSNNETNFYVYRWNGMGWSLIKTLGANVTTYTDSTGLNADTTYLYTVAAHNNNGDAWLSQAPGYVSVMTKNSATPAPPFNLVSTVVTEMTGRKQTFSWKDNSTNEDYFLLESGVAGADGPIFSASPPSYRIDADKTFYSKVFDASYLPYRIKACNSAGCSAPSNVVWTGGLILN